MNRMVAAKVAVWLIGCMSFTLTMDPAASAPAVPIARTAAQCLSRIGLLLWLLVQVGRDLACASNVAALREVEAGGSTCPEIRRVWALLERAARWTRTLHARLASQGVMALITSPSVARAHRATAMTPTLERPEREPDEPDECFDFATGWDGPMSRTARRRPVAEVVTQIFADLDKAARLLKASGTGKIAAAIGAALRGLLAELAAMLPGRGRRRMIAAFGQDWQRVDGHSPRAGRARPPDG